VIHVDDVVARLQFGQKGAIHRRPPLAARLRLLAKEFVIGQQHETGRLGAPTFVQRRLDDRDEAGGPRVGQRRRLTHRDAEPLQQLVDAFGLGRTHGHPHAGGQPGCQLVYQRLESPGEHWGSDEGKVFRRLFHLEVGETPRQFAHHRVATDLEGWRCARLQQQRTAALQRG